MSNLRPFSCFTFPQGFRISKKFRNWTSGRGGKKTFKQSEQMKKICKKKISPRRFYTLSEQKFSNLRPLLSITFPQGFWKSKKFWHWTLGNGDKKTFKRSEQMKKKSIKKNFFQRSDFTPFMSKSFQIWDHFFPLLFPKDSENLKSSDIGLREVGAKRCLSGVNKLRRKKP